MAETQFDTPIASGSTSSLVMVQEDTYGETPADPDGIIIRHNSETLEVTKQLIESAELRSDRKRADVRYGMRQVGGDIVCEAVYGDLDLLLEAALCGTWTAKRSVTGDDVTVAASGKTYTSAAHMDFVAAGFQAGDKIKVSGCGQTGNNGIKTIANGGVAQHVLTVTETCTDEAASASVVIESAGQILKPSTLRRSFTIERLLPDIDVYQQFVGCFFNGWQMRMAPNGMVQFTFPVLGQDGTVNDSASIFTDPTAPSTNNPMGTADAIITEGTDVIGLATGLDITLTNNGAIPNVIGATKAPSFFLGRTTINGTLTSYLTSKAMIDKFLNETESKIIAKLAGYPVNRTLEITLARVKYNRAQSGVPNESGLPLTMPFEAVYDGTTLMTELLIERSGL